MRKASLVAIAVVLSSVTVLAKNPSPLHGPPPPVMDKRGGPETSLVPAPIDGPPIMFSPAGPLSAIFFGHSSPAKARSAATASTSVATYLRRKETDAVPSTVELINTSPVATDAATDYEASVAAIDQPSGTSTVDAYMHLSGANWQVRAANWTSAPAGSVPSNVYTFPLGAGLTDAADPNVRATYPSTTGIRPGAIYRSFFSGQRSGNNIVNPMRVVVWGSDDGGATWNSSSVAAGTTSTDAYILDKPVMDVSWFQGTLGYIYVAWLEVPLVNGQADSTHARLQLRYNDNGLWTRCSGSGQCLTAWQATTTIVDGNLTQAGPYAPQVVVNPNNGNVYVFWLTSAGQMKMMRFDQTLKTWTTSPIVIASGINLIGVNGWTPFIKSIRAIVLPIMRFNSSTGKVMAVWHALKAPQCTDGAPGCTLDTAIYSMSFNADTITNQLFPSPVIDASGFQLQPSIDDDNSGNGVITYYSTEGSAGNTAFRPFASCIDSTGALACSPVSITGLAANAEVGDYHENYWWTYSGGLGGRWYFSWVQSNNLLGSNLTDEYITALK